MGWVINLFLFLLVGCANKYILPGNRMMTPETQGGLFNSSFEFQQVDANQLAGDVTNRTVDDGVVTNPIKRSGFLIATSFLEPIDLFITHTGGANSLFGMKYQFIGASKVAKGAGHKMAISAAFGSNEHEMEGENGAEFTLSGKEFQLLYGYRFSELWMTYSNLSYSTYNFTGVLRSTDPDLNGLKPNYDTKIMALYQGFEVNFAYVFAKLEGGYQQLRTTDTKPYTNFVFGYSMGLTW